LGSERISGAGLKFGKSDRQTAQDTSAAHRSAEMTAVAAFSGKGGHGLSPGKCGK
jgi:hypothetical protein